MCMCERRCKVSNIPITSGTATHMMVYICITKIVGRDMKNKTQWKTQEIDTKDATPNGLAAALTQTFPSDNNHAPDHHTSSHGTPLTHSIVSLHHPGWRRMTM